MKSQSCVLIKWTAYGTGRSNDMHKMVGVILESLSLLDSTDVDSRKCVVDSRGFLLVLVLDDF